MLSKTAYIRSSLCAKAISKPVAKVKIGNGSFKVPNTQLRLSGAVHRQYTKPDYQSCLALLAEEQQHWVINHGSVTGGSICYFCFVILFAYKGGRKLRELPYHFTRKKKKRNKQLLFLGNRSLSSLSQKLQNDHCPYWRKNRMHLLFQYTLKVQARHITQWFVEKSFHINIICNWIQHYLSISKLYPWVFQR